MRLRENFRFPEEMRRKEERARRLEWWTIFFLLTITALMYFVMGSSQAMRTAWIEDVLSLVPPIAFLIASSHRGKEPDESFPFGRQRIMAIAFTGAAFALTLLGLYMLYDSVMGLVKQHHPTFGHRTILGVRTWEGWFMIGALAYSAIPPVILGRLKQPLAEELHEKTLKADADMNKADWMTAGSAILGILGVGLGSWWADSAAALVISLDVCKDGFTNVRAVFSDLMDQRPTDVERKPMEELFQEMRRVLEALPWVRAAEIRLHEEGATVTGDAFVEPEGGSVTLEQLAQASAAVHDVDWKVYDVVVTAVEDVGRKRSPSAEGERVR